MPRTTSRLIGGLLLLAAIGGSSIALDARGQEVARSPAAATPTPTAAPSATPAPTAFAFGAPSYAFTLETVKDGEAVVDILGARSREVEVELVLNLRGGDEKAVVDDRFVVPSKVTVPRAARETATIELASGTEPGPGTYEGWLAGFEGSDTPVARVPITITVPGEGGATVAKPLGAKLTVQATRWVPFVDDLTEVRDAYVPLDASVGKEAKLEDLTIKPQTKLGAVSGDKGGAASVRPKALRTLRYDDVRALELEVENFNGPGTYAGKLDFDPDDEKEGEYELTVVAKDFIFWPALALLLGIYAAYLTRRILGVNRPLANLLGRESDLHTRHEAAMRALRCPPKGEPRPRWADYDTTANFNERANALRTELQALDAASPAAEMPPARRKAAVAELAALEGHVKDLESLPKTAQALRDALEEAEDARLDKLLGDERGDVPGFVVRGRWLVGGRTLSVDGLTEQIKEMKETTAVAEWWVELHETLRADVELLRDLERQRVDVTPALRPLSAAYRAMWRARKAKALRAKRLMRRLDDARWELLLLGDPPDAQGIAGEQRAVAAVLPSFGALPDLPAAAAERSAVLAGYVRGWDRILKRLAFAVAVFAGLVALYFGETFGTPADYLTALFWGFTTATAIDLLLESLPPADEPEEAAAKKDDDAA